MDLALDYHVACYDKDFPIHPFYHIHDVHVSNLNWRQFSPVILSTYILHPLLQSSCIFVNLKFLSFFCSYAYLLYLKTNYDMADQFLKFIINIKKYKLFNYLFKVFFSTNLYSSLWLKIIHPFTWKLLYNTFTHLYLYLHLILSSNIFVGEILLLFKDESYKTLKSQFK